MDFFDSYEKLIDEQEMYSILKEGFVLIRNQFDEVIEENRLLKQQARNLRLLIAALEKREQKGAKVSPDCAEEGCIPVEASAEPVFAEAS